MDIKILLIIFIVLVILDKSITVLNIIQVNKHFPQATQKDYYVVEKNPLAHWFFEKTGLLWGSVLYAFFSILTLFIAYFLLNMAFKSEGIALYVLIIGYGFVICNNLYFLLKYSAIIS